MSDTGSMSRAVALAGLLLLNGCDVLAARDLPASDMPASARLALPGDQHRRLEPLIGRWKVEMKVWPRAGALPIVSSHMRAERAWVLGGRYLREELSGTFAGGDSRRVAMLGYNNLDERFELTTVDTFEPGQMWYASHDAQRGSGPILLHGASTEAGMGASPTGRKRDLRFELEVAADHSVQRIYVKYPAEAEFLFVEQRFTREP